VGLPQPPQNVVSSRLHVDEVVADGLGELLEGDHHGVGGGGDRHELPDPPHPFKPQVGSSK
jgi:hypothetical protein